MSTNVLCGHCCRNCYSKCNNDTAVQALEGVHDQGNETIQQRPSCGTKRAIVIGQEAAYGKDAEKQNQESTATRMHCMEKTARLHMKELVAR